MPAPILLVVGPGRGALRTPEIVGELEGAGRRVEVVLDAGAKSFVGPAAFEGRVVEEPSERPLALVFGPATAGMVSRLARGLGAGPAYEHYHSGLRPAVVAVDLDPATADHPAVRENLGLLGADGCRVLYEETSPLRIAGEALNALGGPLGGLEILVTAGGTREPIDRVRVISNRSSGKMGRAVAREAWRQGARVTLVAANMDETEPGVGWVPVETYSELEEATLRLAGESDALVMAAAISDFAPQSVEEGKIRRGAKKELDLKLIATGDVLRAVREKNPGLCVVGFAATHGDPVADAREKLESKGADLVVGNDISLAGSGFGSDENEVHIVGRGGAERFVSRVSKTEVARAILQELAGIVGKKG